MTRSWGRLQAVAVSGSVGEGLLLTALPLLAVSITTDPREVALVNVVGQAPWLLFSLFAGVVIDRVRRTTVLAWAFAVQACVALVLAVAGTADALSLPLLLVVAFLVTSTKVLGDGAAGALLPEVVEPARFTAANTRLLMIDQGFVRFVVPPVTGYLLAAGAGLPAWGACVAAVLAVVLTRGIPSARAAVSTTHPLRDLADGLKFLVGSLLLRSITVAVALGSFAASAGTAMFVLYAKEVLHVGDVGYGLLLACMAIGWVASSFVVDRIVTRIGYAWSMRLGQTVAMLTQLAVALVPPWPGLVGAVLATLTAGTLVWNVCSQSSRQHFTPSVLLGRVLTSHRALAWGLTPLGALAGGLVAAHWGLRAVWVMGALVQFVVLVFILRPLSPAAFREAELVASSR